MRSTPRRARTPGPLANTGITLEIRAGGPFINFSPPAQQIYADPTIFAGYADTGDVIRNAGGEQPLVSIFASYDKGPQILMWDPEAYPDMATIDDVRESGATVLYFEGAAYMDYLLETGLLDAGQIDGSYDGSPGRFVAEGNLVQQGFATNEVYKYENDIADWMKPVEFLLIHDTGFDIYQSALSVRPESITEYGDCLAALVPIFQQAQVDYVTDPGPMNEKFVDIVTELDTFWQLSTELNDDAVQRMLDLELVSDAGNETLGDFDCARVDALIEKLRPVFEAKGDHDPRRHVVRRRGDERVHRRIDLAGLIGDQLDATAAETGVPVPAAGSRRRRPRRVEWARAGRHLGRRVHRRVVRRSSDRAVGSATLPDPCARTTCGPGGSSTATCAARSSKRRS